MTNYTQRVNSSRLNYSVFGRKKVALPYGVSDFIDRPEPIRIDSPDVNPILSYENKGNCYPAGRRNRVVSSRNRKPESSPNFLHAA